MSRLLLVTWLGRAGILRLLGRELIILGLLRALLRLRLMGGVMVLLLTLAAVCRRKAMGSMKFLVVIAGEVAGAGVEMVSSAVGAEVAEDSEAMGNSEGGVEVVSGADAARWENSVDAEAAIGVADSEVARKDRLVAPRKSLRVCPPGKPLILTLDRDFCSSRLAMQGRSLLPSTSSSVLAF